MGLSGMPSANDAFFPLMLLANIILPFTFLRDGVMRLLVLLTASNDEQPTLDCGDRWRRLQVHRTRFKPTGAAGAEMAAEGRCSVCLHGYKEGEETSEVVRCRHLFHRDCLDRWVVEHSRGTCPLCRSALY